MQNECISVHELLDRGNSVCDHCSVPQFSIICGGQSPSMSEQGTYIWKSVKESAVHGMILLSLQIQLTLPQNGYTSLIVSNDCGFSISRMPITCIRRDH